jgi:hypothetical protein
MHPVNNIAARPGVVVRAVELRLGLDGASCFFFYFSVVPNGSDLVFSFQGTIHHNESRNSVYWRSHFAE